MQAQHESGEELVGPGEQGGRGLVSEHGDLRVISAERASRQPLWLNTGCPPLAALEEGLLADFARFMEENSRIAQAASGDQQESSTGASGEVDKSGRDLSAMEAFLTSPLAMPPHHGAAGPPPSLGDRPQRDPSVEREVELGARVHLQFQESDHLLLAKTVRNSFWGEFIRDLKAHEDARREQERARQEEQQLRQRGNEDLSPPGSSPSSPDLGPSPLSLDVDCPLHRSSSEDSTGSLWDCKVDKMRRRQRRRQRRQSREVPEVLPFFSSFTLMPPGGKGMSLFGSESRSSCGLLVDGRALGVQPELGEALDLPESTTEGEEEEDEERGTGGVGGLRAAGDGIARGDPRPPVVLAWPPGVYAKTEFNVDRATGRVTSAAVRRASCSVARLQEMNRRRELYRFDKVVSLEETSMQALPYNEVFVEMRAAGIAGLFARSFQTQHLLFLLGLQHRIQVELGALVPVFVLTSEAGLQPCTPADQARLVQSYVKHCTHCPETPPTSPRSDGGGVLPLDVHKFSTHLTPLQRVVLHAAYSIDPEAVELALREEEVRTGVAEHVVFAGLVTAVEANNSAAAEVLVRAAVPLLLNQLARNTARSAGRRVPGLEGEGVASLEEPAGKYHVQAQPAWGYTTIVDTASQTPVLQIPVPLALQPRSDRMLAVLGSYQALLYVTSGETQYRIAEACRVLQDWLRESSSLTFRLSSWWRESRRRSESLGRLKEDLPADLSLTSEETMPALAPFLGSKAIANRTKFLHALHALQESSRTQGQYLRALYDIMLQLNKPSLRLELLQYVLGLDSRFHRSVLLDAVGIALSAIDIEPRRVDLDLEK